MTRGLRREAVGILVVVFVLSVLWTVPAWATDRYVDPTGNDTGDCSNPASPCKTITYAIGQAAGGDTIYVAAGTYQENIVIDKNIKLLSQAGRANTTIEGQSGVNALGTIVISGNTTGVQIGDINQGFKIIGIDNGNPAVENGAVYIKGGISSTHSNGVIKGNEIVANGDHGLVAEYGAVITNFVIDGNIFSGQTFVGATPGGCGFGNQFSEPNVPRQLVVMGNGEGDAASANVKNIQFTNNQITGTAGGPGASGSGCETTGQGNTLVTLDVANSLIYNNTFNGYTTRYAHSLRVRRPNTLIIGNSFNGGSPYGVFIGGTIGTTKLTCNNIAGHTLAGVANSTTTPLDAKNNWWGCAAGPGDDSCDITEGLVNFNPWLRREAPQGVMCGLDNITDTDGDGLSDILEMGGTGDQDRNTTTDPLDEDTDDDGLLDKEDENGNGRVDAGETNPSDPDTDDDGLCDGSASLPTASSDVCPTSPHNNKNGEDLDGDEAPADRGIDETDPTKPDTDNDGVNDFEDEFPLRVSGVCYGVAAYSSPSRVTYRPTTRRPASRTISVTIVNNSGAPLIVPANAFKPQAGEPFVIKRVSPTLVTILNGRRRTFYIYTQVAAGQPPVTTYAPYFNIALQCGVLTSAGTRLTALGEIQVDSKENQLRIQAHGLGIGSLQLQLFDLSGRLVIDRSSQGSVLNISLTDAQTSLANGVYLYVVRVRGFNGEEYVSEVRKLVISR